MVCGVIRWREPVQGDQHCVVLEAELGLICGLQMRASYGDVLPAALCLLDLSTSSRIQCNSLQPRIPGSSWRGACTISI